MSVIAPTNMQGAGSRALVKTTLTSSDSFVYKQGSVLVLDNVTGGALTVNIDGSGGSVVPVKGVGDVSVAAGYNTPAIAAGAAVVIPLDSISSYLKGTIAVTGGTGIKASLLQF